MEVKKLDLPLVPVHLQRAILDFSTDLGRNTDSQQWLENFHDNCVNVVGHNFVELPADITNSLLAIYQPFFDSKIVPVIGVMRNLKDTPAWLLPHCDRTRYLAINFYIDLGGDNVYTHFYDYVRTSNDLTESVNLKFNQVTEVAKYKFNTNEWVCYGVQQCHAVSGVQTTRVFLGLIPLDNPTFTDFCNTYNKINKEPYENFNA